MQELDIFAVDYAQLQEMPALLNDRFSEILEMYIEEGSEALRHIHNLLKDEDSPASAKLAGTLKHSSHWLGFRGMANAARALEQAVLKAIDNHQPFTQKEIVLGLLDKAFYNARKVATEYKQNTDKKLRSA